MRVLLLANQNQTSSGLDYVTFFQLFSLVILIWHGALRIRHFASVAILIFSQKLALMLYLVTSKRNSIKVHIYRTILFNPQGETTPKVKYQSILKTSRTGDAHTMMCSYRGES